MITDRPPGQSMINPFDISGLRDFNLFYVAVGIIGDIINRMSWSGAQGYNVLWGIAPDKLYSSWMVYDENELFMRSLTTTQDYYFCVEAFNENGVAERSEILHCK